MVFDCVGEPTRTSGRVKDLVVVSSACGVATVKGMLTIVVVFEEFSEELVASTSASL